MKPDPTLPTYTSRSPSWTPTARAPSLSCLLPSPGSHPPMTTSWEGRFLTLIQAEERRAGLWQGESSRLATIPSSPCAAVASSSAAPSPSRCAGTCQLGPFRSSSLSSERRSRYARRVRRSALQPEHVEDHVGRPGPRAFAVRTAESEAKCMRDWSRSKLGLFSESKATISPSRMSRREPSASPSARISG